MLAADTPAALTQARRGQLTLEVDLQPGRRPVWPDGLVVSDRGRLRATAPVPQARAAAVVGWASDELAAGRIERYSLTPASLEDVYVDLVETPQESAA